MIEINQINLITLKFVQPINNSINISCINDTYILIYVQPANNIQDDDDFDWNTVQLTWNLNSTYSITNVNLAKFHWSSLLFSFHSTRQTHELPQWLIDYATNS